MAAGPSLACGRKAFGTRSWPQNGQLLETNSILRTFYRVESILNQAPWGMNLEGKEHYEDAVCSTAVGRHTARNARGRTHFPAFGAGSAAKSPTSARQNRHPHLPAFTCLPEVQLPSSAQATPNLA